MRHGLRRTAAQWHWRIAAALDALAREAEAEHYSAIARDLREQAKVERVTAATVAAQAVKCAPRTGGRSLP